MMGATSTRRVTCRWSSCRREHQRRWDLRPTIRNKEGSFFANCRHRLLHAATPPRLRAFYANGNKAYDVDTSPARIGANQVGAPSKNPYLAATTPPTRADTARTLHRGRTIEQRLGLVKVAAAEQRRHHYRKAATGATTPRRRRRTPDRAPISATRHRVGYCANGQRHQQDHSGGQTGRSCTTRARRRSTSVFRRFRHGGWQRPHRKGQAASSGPAAERHAQLRLLSEVQGRGGCAGREVGPAPYRAQVGGTDETPVQRKLHRGFGTFWRPRRQQPVRTEALQKQNPPGCQRDDEDHRGLRI